jgi:phosphoglycerate dehydrogenase-like enzyme
MPPIETQIRTPQPALAPGQLAQFDGLTQTTVTPAPAQFLMAGAAFDHVYGPEERAAISARVPISNLLVTPEDYRDTSETWPDVEMIFTGWGMPVMDEAFFRRFPKVKAVFYAAGTVRGFVTDLFWRRKVRLTNAAAANAVSVAEFSHAQILLALKQAWQQSRYIREHGKFPPLRTLPGTYQTTVGLISLGVIGRLVAERLLQTDLRVVAYDPVISPEEAARLGVKLVSLEEIFALSDVVSCHAPVLKETEKMIQGHHFDSMKPDATFINTARGIVVNEKEMIEALQKRPDIYAMLDVTEPLPPAEGSPLYTLDNVMLTPHIAGSLNLECRRMGRLMVDELDRYLAGKPLRYEIDRQRFQLMA